ncbi:MAG: hypothetical protein NTY53_26985, partial [Kiritimatiellaeota bacterium]|nr:hypothetical protein [Kiritimatiellota bacterium]
MKCFLRSLVVFYLGAVGVVRGGALPDLTIFLGQTNRGAGLEITDGGDGANVAVDVDGVPARKVSGQRSSYLYVRINHPAWTNAPCAAYVSAEVLDERFMRVQVEYDRANEVPDIRALYTRSKQTLLLTGTGRWRTLTFFLPDLRLGHGENGNTDFRFVGRGLTVRHITLAQQAPPDFNPEQPVDPEALRALKTARPAGMELTFGNDATL